MARKALYDLDEIIPLAIDLFWQKGYAGTSMDELINYTGFNRRSMYAEFGNKQAFYHTVVKRYIDAKLLPIVSALENNRGQVSIEAFFYKFNRFVYGRGCLLTNAVTELAHSDETIKAIAGNYFQKLRQLFEACLKHALQHKEIRPDINIESFSLELITLIQGLGVMAKLCSDKQELDIAVESVLKPISTK